MHKMHKRYAQNASSNCENVMHKESRSVVPSHGSVMLTFVASEGAIIRIATGLTHP